MIARVGVLIGALAGGVLLVGCQGRPEPVESPSHSAPPPTSSPAPTSTVVPVIPETASEKSKRGAKTFAEYFYRLVDYGRGTGNWKPLRSLSLPGCRQCADFWSPSPSRMNNRNAVSLRQLPRVNAPGSQAGDTEIVAVTITTLWPPDRPRGLTTGVLFSDQVELVYRGGSWKVKEIDVEEIG